MATQVMNNTNHHHHHHVTFSSSSGGLHNHTSPPGPRTSYSMNNGLVLNGGYNPISSVEHDNPFRPGSELIEEAENILKNVTIVGSQVTISGNDSGIGVTSPPHKSGSPQANGCAEGAVSPHNVTQLQCSTILSTSNASGGGKLDVTEDRVVRASPETMRPESPAMRAEHVLVTTKGDIRSSPSQQLPDNTGAPSSSPDSSSKDKKKKKKKKCTLL